MKDCENCADDFKPRQTNQRFCGSSCRQAWYHLRKLELARERRRKK